MSWKIEKVFMFWLISNILAFISYTPVVGGMTDIAEGSLTNGNLLNTVGNVKFFWKNYWIISTLAIVIWSFIAPTREEAVSTSFVGGFK